MNYIKSRVEFLWNNGNKMHAVMLSKYIQNPISFELSESIFSEIRKKGSDLPSWTYALPYESMAIAINQTIEINKFKKIHLHNLHLGIAQVEIPVLTKNAKLQALSLIKRFKWLIDNMSSFEDINVVSDLPEAVDEFWNIAQDTEGFPSKILSLRGAKGIVRENAARWLNMFMLKNQSGEYEKVEALAWLCEYTSHSGERHDVFDWYNTGEFFSEFHSLNDLYFEDGYHDKIVNPIFDFIKGFTSAWSDKILIEKTRVGKSKKFKRRGKKSKQKVVRTLKYSTSHGAMVSTVSKQEEAVNSSSGSEKSPHVRRGSYVKLWVLAKNVQNEEILEVKERNGKTLCRVSRWRKEAKVKGGSPVKGVIKAV